MLKAGNKRCYVGSENQEKRKVWIEGKQDQPLSRGNFLRLGKAERRQRVDGTGTQDRAAFEWKT